MSVVVNTIYDFVIKYYYENYSRMHDDFCKLTRSDIPTFKHRHPSKIYTPKKYPEEELFDDYIIMLCKYIRNYIEENIYKIILDYSNVKYILELYLE